MKFKVKMILALMMFANLIQAQTFECQLKNNKHSFEIVENWPEPGMASLTYTTSGGDTSILKFTESQTEMSTRLGIVSNTEKIYFHPYYEYQLSKKIYIDYPDLNDETYYGIFVSEMNKNQTFTCVETINK